MKLWPLEAMDEALIQHIGSDVRTLIFNGTAPRDSTENIVYVRKGEWWHVMRLGPIELMLKDIAKDPP